MTVSLSLKKLVASGYVKHTEDREDTRAKSVRLTKKGKALAEKLVPIIEKIDDEFFGVLPKTERMLLISKKLNNQ